MSLLCRLAYRAGESDVDAFTRDLGLKRTEVEDGTANRQLALLSGVPLALLEDWSVSRLDGRTLSYRGETLLQKYDWAMPGERTYGASYCPKCLQEDLQKDGTGEGPRELRAYWRSWWDITSVRVCDRHGTHLLQGCPSPDCRMPIVLRGGSLYTCSECRADLTEGSAPTLPGSVGEFQRYVHGRIALAPKVRMPELDDMPICHAEELCWRLGMAERRVSIAPLE